MEEEEGEGLYDLSIKEREVLLIKVYQKINKLIYEMVPEWKSIEKFRNHRTKLKSIENIKEIKDKLWKIFGYSPVYWFLNRFKAVDYPGPYLNVDSLLLILYQMHTGHSQDTTFIPKSSFGDIYRKFWFCK